MSNRFQVLDETREDTPSQFQKPIFNPNFFGTYAHLNQDKDWTVVSKWKENIMDPFYKTTMCKYLDNCRRKKTCKYAHNQSEKKSFYHPKDLKPIDFTWRTKMCQNGDACHKEDCGFAHNPSELRKVPCKYQSFCKKIGKCERAHYFLEPHMMVQTMDMKNNSLALRGQSIFQEIEKKLAISTENLKKIEKNMDNCLQKIDYGIKHKTDQLNELQKIDQEYETMYKEIENEMNQTIPSDSKESEGKKKKRNFVWDSDDESQQTKKYKSWASHTESDTEIDTESVNDNNDNTENVFPKTDNVQGKNKLSWSDIIKKNIT